MNTTRVVAALTADWQLNCHLLRIMNTYHICGCNLLFVYAMASPAMGHWGTCPSTSNNFIYCSVWSKSDSQLSKYCVVCEISWCRCQQLTALSISTASVTKLLVIEQLLLPALKFAVSAPWPNFQLCPSSQQILATPLCIWLQWSQVPNTRYDHPCNWSAAATISPRIHSVMKQNDCSVIDQSDGMKTDRRGQRLH